MILSMNCRELLKLQQIYHRVWWREQLQLNTPGTHQAITHTTIFECARNAHSQCACFYDLSWRKLLHSHWKVHMVIVHRIRIYSNSTNVYFNQHKLSQLIFLKLSECIIIYLALPVWSKYIIKFSFLYDTNIWLPIEQQNLKTARSKVQIS